MLHIKRYAELYTHTQRFDAIFKIFKEKNIEHEYIKQDYKETQLDTIIVKFTPKTLKILNEATLDKPWKKLVVDEDYATLLKEYKNKVEYLHVILRYTDDY